MFDETWCELRLTFMATTPIGSELVRVETYAPTCVQPQEAADIFYSGIITSRCRRNHGLRVPFVPADAHTGFGM